VFQVAYRLRVSPEFVRRLIRGRQLPAIRIGGHWRIDPCDLQAYLDQARTIEKPVARVQPDDGQPSHLSITRAQRA
jgi:excisionase family DNA binding protein